MKLKIKVALCAMMTLSGCATITRGSTTEFLVRSTPPGARVSTSNGFGCDATPCIIDLPRKTGFWATMSMPGYHPQTVQVTTKLSSEGAAGMAASLFYGGIIGGAVDATSGSMNDLTPNPLIITLQPMEDVAQSSARPAASGSSLATPTRQ